MKTYKFSSRIEAARSGGACVFFPFDVEKEFGTKGRVPVNASFDGVPYSGSMIKYGHPQHMLPILKAIRARIGKAPGDMVEVEVKKDEEQRTIAVPVEFEKLLKTEKLRPFFTKLSYSHQKEYCRWITEAKKEETRRNRMAKAVDMLRRGVKTPD